MKVKQRRSGSSETPSVRLPTTLTDGVLIYDVPGVCLDARRLARTLSASTDEAARQVGVQIVALLSRAIVAMGADDIRKIGNGSSAATDAFPSLPADDGIVAAVPAAQSLILVIDTEALRPTRPDSPDFQPELGIEYAGTWAEEQARDFAGMGVACAVLQEAWTGREWRFACENPQHYDDLQALFNKAVLIVGYNLIGYDARALRSEGFRVDLERCFDIQREIVLALGRDPLKGESFKGLSLGKVASANGLSAKSGSGADAPIDWQRDEREKVLQYCADDTTLHRQLFELICERGWLALPDGGRVEIAKPEAVR